MKSTGVEGRGARASEMGQRPLNLDHKQLAEVACVLTPGLQNAVARVKVYD